jgi:hypothetical protein
MVNAVKEKNTTKIFAITLMLIACVFFIAISPFRCWMLPAHQTDRFIKLYAKPDILFFRVEGYHLCPVTAEGFFPAWESTVRVRMVNRSNFLLMGKDLFVYPDDFVVEGADISSGSLRVDKKKSEVTVTFNFKTGYVRLKPVNGTFSMKDVKPAVPLPAGVEP